MYRILVVPRCRRDKRYLIPIVNRKIFYENINYKPTD